MKKIIMTSVALLIFTAPAFAQTMPPVKTTEPVATGTQAASISYPTLMSTAVFTSKIQGLTIYNQENKSVGEIEDIAIGANRVVEAYIVSVGGFLGMGEHYVAISPSAVELKWDLPTRKWTAKMMTTVDQLKAAPQFTYPK
jgi:sporulation protein YlmC with PRC-barrel domain